MSNVSVEITAVKDGVHIFKQINPTEAKTNLGQADLSLYEGDKEFVFGVVLEEALKHSSINPKDILEITMRTK